MKKYYKDIKEKKSYFLIEYCGYKDIEYKDMEELKDAFERIRKYNNRKTAKFLIGNMTYQIVDDHIVLRAFLYNKLTNRSTISELDEYTSNFSEKGLIMDNYDKLITSNAERNTYKKSFYPDINIAYLMDKDHKENSNVIRRIKYIPVLYYEDKKYLDRNYIFNCIKSHEIDGDIDFFIKIVDTFKYEHDCFDILDRMTREIDLVKNQGHNLSGLYYLTTELYNELIVERNKDGSLIRGKDGFYQISRRRQRDFGFFVKNYNNSKTKSTTAYTYLDSKTKLKEMKDIRRALLKQRNALSETKDENEMEQLKLKLYQ